ncbi:DNA repair protein RadC [Candidatus Haliotispira prima]|uniref:DNA repair protein RadC n=1 Tax=Candidatus Haliotispira prima TaxID=3034016 RepID=A0ABY8MGM9_9SPIO|nr:DNA repair protein RadC [Candidatus Haliotispira prima]
MLDQIEALRRELGVEMLGKETTPRPECAGKGKGTSVQTRQQETRQKTDRNETSGDEEPDIFGSPLSSKITENEMLSLFYSKLQAEELGDFGEDTNEKNGTDTLRPREKLEANGVQSLTNIELLCLLLGSGNREQSVRQLATKVLQQLLQRPFDINLESLQNIKGMGLGKSASVLAAMEIARRFLNPGPKQLNNPEAIHKQIAHFADQQENLVAINLNGACEALSIRLITRGTINRSLIHPREVFTHAIREQAHSVVIAHNHPTGHLEPSKEDLETTRRLQEAAKILGIKLLDHIIFSETSCFSFAEEGLMKN